MYTFAKADINIGKWLINPGVRVDHFNHAYQNQLDSAYTNKSQNVSIVSPKLNFIYTPTNNIQYFLKLGKGFHSNDTRVVIAQQAETILPASYGADLGLLWKPAPQWLVNGALWYLFLEQEFVYVGDEGIVEPSGKTQRLGGDLGIRYQPSQSWFFYADYTFSHGKAIEEAAEANRIPLAPRSTFTGGITYQHKGVVAGLSARSLGDRPAVEDNSIVAKGYTIMDMNVSYTTHGLTFGLSAQNILNMRWKETQFATESQLRNETTPVEEIHFTPGTPLNVRGSVSYAF
jgi:outer membrane receptor protein involved in Fe transport